MTKRNKIISVSLLGMAIFLGMSLMVGKLYFASQQKQLISAVARTEKFLDTIPTLASIQSTKTYEYSGCGWHEQGFVYAYDCNVIATYHVDGAIDIVKLHSQLEERGWKTDQIYKDGAYEKYSGYFNKGYTLSIKYYDVNNKEVNAARIEESSIHGASVSIGRQWSFLQS